MARPPTLTIAAEAPDRDMISTAAGVIRRGGLVVFPTETVYGLGADCTNPEAVSRVFVAKGRQADKPLLVLIGSVAWLPNLTDQICEGALRIIDVFWPGPLTITFPAIKGLPAGLLAGGQSVGIRLPGSRLARDLANAVGKPITASSANRSGTKNPVTAIEAVSSLGPGVDLVLDGGPSPNSQGSTVIDVSRGRPILLREGRIPFSQVEDVYDNKG
jgi:L-threonylcarbamoyladenylate synthase